MISKVCQEILHKILKQNQVIIFPIPLHLDDIKIKGIKKRIQGLRYYTLRKNATTSLNGDAKIYLDKLAKEVVERLNGCSKFIEDEIQNFSNNYYRTAQ